jgi:hypothetical protein
MRTLCTGILGMGALPALLIAELLLSGNGRGRHRKMSRRRPYRCWGGMQGASNPAGPRNPEEISSEERLLYWRLCPTHASWPAYGSHGRTGLEGAIRDDRQRLLRRARNVARAAVFSASSARSLLPGHRGPSQIDPRHSRRTHSERLRSIQQGPLPSGAR